MKYQTVCELAEIFFRVRGYAPNQIWAHPSTIDYIKASLNNDNFLGMRKVYLDPPSFQINTVFGILELRKDDRVMPGVIYLDRDGQHTGNAFRKHYESLSIDYGVLSKLAK